MLRRYPVKCTETFRVDRLHDVLTMRSAFEYIDIRDEWGTTPRTLAPTLALALTDDRNTFPMRFSAPVIDPFVMMSHGPYMGIEGQDSYEIEFDTLEYFNEVEHAEPPPSDAPRLVREADERLQATAALKWPAAGRMAVGDAGVAAPVRQAERRAAVSESLGAVLEPVGGALLSRPYPGRGAP